MNEAQTSHGLDKASRLEAERLAKLAIESEPLNPAFPYVMIPLDVEFFGL